MPPSLRPSALPDHLLSEGRYWVTSQEAADLLDRSSRSTYPRLAELEHTGKLFSPAKGLYVVVPPEYRQWQAVPGDWFIDPMMHHLERSYYVAFLSAAARHGASHQAAQSFQVIVDRHLDDREFGRVRLHFVRRADAKDADHVAMNSRTSSYLVATSELTLVDLAWRPREGGGMSNVATVVKDIGKLRAEHLARLAATRSRGTARRLGWLIERFRPDIDLFWLRQVARPAEGSPAVLIPGNTPRGPVDSTWNLCLNGRVEPD